jgi:hypothetical protein
MFSDINNIVKLANCLSIFTIRRSSERANQNYPSDIIKYNRKSNRELFVQVAARCGICQTCPSNFQRAILSQYEIISVATVVGLYLVEISFLMLQFPEHHTDQI